MKLSDRAIADRAADVLGRWGIATTIHDLITNAQTDSALRVGVYGGWGEGKTSVLRLVESLAVNANIPVCWFSVWSAQTQSDLWSGLFDALQSLPQKPYLWGKMKAWTSKATAKTEAVADLTKYTKAAHSLAKLAKIGPDDAKRAISGIGTSGRVVILVDDVDRVDAALIPKLLMGLHDLFDELSRCAFVIALDPAVVTGGLSQMNPAWSSAPEFLEKIVQYPFRLPRPTEEQMQRLVVEALDQSRLNLPRQAFLDLLDLLPPNPRKVKQFIRSLLRLQPILSRYGADEWNPTLLLLIELLRTASAEATEELLQDRKFIEELVLGRVFTRKEDMRDGDKITNKQYGRIEAAVALTMPLASPEARTRVVQQLSETVSAATDRLAFVTVDDAIRHVRLDHEPPVITLREFDHILSAWQDEKSKTDLTALLSKHAATHGRSDSEVLDVYVLALLTRRAELINSASDAFDSTEAQQFVQQIEMHSSLLERLIVDHNVLADTRIVSRVRIFMAMRTQTAQFVNRLSDAIYAPVRVSLREQLFRASAYLRDRAADVLKELRPWDKQDTGPDVAGAVELRETRERVNTIFSQFLCDSVLERFRRPGGVAAIGNFLSSPAETWLVLTPDTAFYKPDCRASLLSIAQEKDQVVAQNFFVYLRMLAGESGFATSSIMADAAFVVPAWQAASRVRPQPKMQGQVVELVKRLRAALKDDSLIPMPSWIESIQEVTQELPSAPGTPEGIVPT